MATLLNFVQHDTGRLALSDAFGLSLNEGVRCEQLARLTPSRRRRCQATLLNFVSTRHREAALADAFGLSLNEEAFAVARVGSFNAEP